MEATHIAGSEREGSSLEERDKPTRTPFLLNPAGSRYCLPPPEKTRVFLPATNEERYRSVSSVAQTDECIQPAELRELLEKSENPVAYDGFEPSGRMHVAQGLMKMFNVEKMTDAGFTYVFWIADRFALLNNKMGGDPEKIKTVGKYFIEVWKAAGMDVSRVKFVWASEEIDKYGDEYWKLVMDIATKFSVSRITRCTEIMGRSETDNLSAGQILYPCMQCADIFFLGVDVCQLGVDQRKVNVLAREYANFYPDELKKPVILSHHMLMGLKQKEGDDTEQIKMSKSNPDSAIFMEDTEEEVRRKIGAAYCPPKTLTKNPCMDYAKNIVFGGYHSVTVEREEKHGGDSTFNSYEELESAYANGDVHPKDLKAMLSKYINRLLEPVRVHFENDQNAKELFERVCEYRKIGSSSSSPRSDSSNKEETNDDDDDDDNNNNNNN